MAPTLELHSHSEAETTRIGAALADALEPGTIVALVGHLGAGKTRLVLAVALGADVDPREVTSPTFVLVQEYTGRWPIYHFDAYRLHGATEFLDLGAEEYLHGKGVCFVEWADRLEGTLGEDLRIDIAAMGPTSRRMRIAAGTPRGERVLERLRVPT